MTEQEWLASDDPAAMVRFLTEDTFKGKDHWRGCERPSERKLRLFACACVRQAHELTGGCQNPDSIRLADLSDDYADGLISYSTLQEFKPSHPDCTWPLRYDHNVHTTILNTINDKAFLPGQAALLRTIVGNPFRVLPIMWHAGQPYCNPRKPKPWPEPNDPVHAIWAGHAWEMCPWLTWKDGTVPKMAQVIYDERRWDQMSMLADALEDAGCHDERILKRLRRPENCTACDNTGIGTDEYSGTSVIIGGCPRCGGESGPFARGDWVIDLLIGKE